MSTWPLSWIEYFVVAITVVGTMTVGLIFSRSSSRSLEEYMFGGRKMSVFPICMSITATLMTGHMIVTSGTETYMYGSQMFLSGNLTFILSSIVAAGCYIPVFRALKSVSPFEYFDRRYNKKVRTFVSVISVLDAFQYIVISIYVPALTFSEACGLSMFTVACLLSITCFVYTVTGGLKAVAWADTFQMFIIIFCSVYIFSVGLYKSGGVAEVFRILDEGYRVHILNFNPSPFERATFWTGFGVFLSWTPYYLSPTQHQRYLSVPTLRQAQKVVLWSILLMMVVVAFDYSVGLLAYAYYAGCDPVLAKMGPKSYYTIIPYYISDIAKDLPGVTGLFHAGMIAAGLSTTTSLWNTLACTIFEDLVRPRLRDDLPERTAKNVVLGLVFIIAVTTTACVYWMQFLGGLVEATAILRATTQSTMFVLFNSGMFFPWVNAKGALAGAIGTVAVTITLLAGSIQAKRAGLTKDIPKLLSTEACPADIITSLGNKTLTIGGKGYEPVSVADDGVFWLFKLSVYLFQVPGVVVGLVVAILVSFLTGSSRLDSVDPAMIVPQMRWLLPKNKNSTNPDAINEDDVPLKAYHKIPLNEEKFHTQYD